MTALVRVPRHVAVRKPPHGAPCNRCGLCCFMSLCALGEKVFNRPPLPGPCPGLVKDGDGTYACDVARNPDKYKPGDVGVLRAAAQEIIFAGDGCDCRINGEPINHAYRRRCEKKEKANLVNRIAALKIWGIVS